MAGRVSPVTGPRATAWMAADGLTISDQIALDALAEDLAGLYDVGFSNGEFHAFRLIGGPLITADTLAGIDSAIRADWDRWQRASGRAS